MTDSENKITPMMKQFLELKKQYNDCILLFRAGDFYETFYDDAKVSNKVLGITLTKRGNTPMAGVPFHSINPYIKKFINNGYKVAICEQLESAEQSKGLVKRGVTRIITPGTIIEEDYLDNNENNYIMCIYIPKNISEKFGISIADITTGDFFTTQISKTEDVKTLIKKYEPKEIILNETNFIKGLKTFIKNSNIYFNFLSDIRFNKIYANQILKKQFKYSPKELGIDEKQFSIISCGALLFYIHKLQKLDLSHINKIKYLNLTSNMLIDSISLKNLEISNNLFNKDKNKTLFGILNNTKTSMGARLLKKQLISPLLNKKQITKRLNAVEEFNELIFQRDQLRELLDNFYDIKRISSRISSHLATPKDLQALKLSLEKLPQIKESLSLFSTELLKELKKINLLKDITELIEKSICENAPNHTRDIGYIKKTYNKELENLFNIAFNSKDFLQKLEEKEKNKTGITTLKIKYNKVFGYFIEIPKTQTNKVPDDYIPKQTLTNSMRYTKPELKQKENEIFGAEEKIKNLEKQIFDNILDKLKLYIKKLQQISDIIALLDVISTHSYNSQIYGYIKPEFNENITNIINGRNPIVERFTDHYIPNDIKFDNKETFKIITGPNMSGKSTALRQMALISIMAQSGSFIPAEKAELKIYNRIFTRIGAYDELAEGQSTFMVEMTETANILNNANNNSLVLLDEIGRGTSTYDGLSIAWAVTEELANLKSDTMFATHYHQLNKLSNYYDNIENYNVLVKEEGENIEFIRKIVKGGTDKSYGIYVGKLAGIPQHVLERAKQIQSNIEEKEEITIKQDFNPKTNKKTKKSLKSEKGLNNFI